jgi:hypothetical protein
MPSIFSPNSTSQLIQKQPKHVLPTKVNTMETDVDNQNDSLELLYHVKRAIIDFDQDKSGAT